MDTLPKYDVPWELISESLAGTLTAEEELQLQQWLSSHPDHKTKYLHIQELWRNGMEDYKLYQTANENEAWKALHSKLEKINPEHTKTRVIQGQFTQRHKLIRNFIAIAAVFIGLVGIGLWFIVTQHNPTIYETAANVQKKVILTDGSSITLQPFTKIEISSDYNKTNRTTTMVSGEAYFEIEHHSDKPFIVALGTTQIKDIGTTFTIQKGEKEINVSVTTGKVAFAKLATNETRELNAGTGITFDVRTESFGEIKMITSSSSNGKLLNFEDTPLSEVIVAIQKAYGKKIIIRDSNMTDKKITAKLDGMTYHSAIKVICKSLGLEYSVNDSVYILKQKTSEQP